MPVAELFLFRPVLPDSSTKEIPEYSLGGLRVAGSNLELEAGTRFSI